MTLPQIAAEVGRSEADTRRLLARAARIGLVVHGRRFGKCAPTRYPASSIEVVKAMAGVPFRPVPEGSDWLTPYERKST